MTLTFDRIRPLCFRRCQTGLVSDQLRFRPFDLQTGIVRNQRCDDLARYHVVAFEYQYLRFSGVADPRTFFLRSSWFGEQYLDQGILSEAAFDRLFAAMGRICDGYAVDEARFRG